MRSSTAEYAQWNALMSVNDTVGVCVCVFFFSGGRYIVLKKKTRRAIPYRPISQKAIMKSISLDAMNAGWYRSGHQSRVVSLVVL